MRAQRGAALCALVRAMPVVALLDFDRFGCEFRLLGLPEEVGILIESFTGECNVVAEFGMLTKAMVKLRNGFCQFWVLERTQAERILQ